MFFFKRKQIVVDAFAELPKIIEMSPIEETRKFLPEWWKQLPKEITVTENKSRMPVPAGTLKICDGFLDYNRTGFIMPQWQDVKVVTRRTGQWAAETSLPTRYPIIKHGEEQHGPAFSDWINMKILSPWVLKTKSDIKFYWNQATWHTSKNWNNVHILPGVVQFKYSNQTNIPLFAPKRDNEFFIYTGDPLVHIVPITEYDVVIKMHQVTIQEFGQLASDRYDRSFINSYKKYKQSVEAKCPFGFK
jgi:hypothetical protein